jgi:hypothetical protein
MQYTIINTFTHEVAYQGKSSSAAGRKQMQLGAMPKGWIKVRGNVADAKAAATVMSEKYPASFCPK